MARPSVRVVGYAHVDPRQRASARTLNGRTCGISLARRLSNGEFSVEVEGLRPNGPDHKLKIFSMNDRDGDISFSDMCMSQCTGGDQRQPGKLHRVQGGVRQSGRQSRSRTGHSAMRAVTCSTRRARISGRRRGAAEFSLVVLDGRRQRQLDLRLWRSRKAGTLRGRAMPGSDRHQAASGTKPARSPARPIEISGSATNLVRRHSATHWIERANRRLSGAEDHGPTAYTTGVGVYNPPGDGLRGWSGAGRGICRDSCETTLWSPAYPAGSIGCLRRQRRLGAGFLSLIRRRKSADKCPNAGRGP